MIQQQEDHYDGHEGGQCQCTAGCLFAFKLTAIFDMITFGELDLFVHLLLDVIDHTPQVAVGYVGGNHDLTFYVFAIDGIRPHGRGYVGNITQGHFFTVLGVDHQVAYLFGFVTEVILYFHNQVETLTLFVNLRNHLSGQCHIDVFRKFRQGNAVFSQHFTFGSDFELRAFNLLFHIQVGNAGDIADGFFYLIAQ